jgi:hypothetical protein
LIHPYFLVNFLAHSIILARTLPLISFIQPINDLKSIHSILLMQYLFPQLLISPLPPQIQFILYRYQLQPIAFSLLKTAVNIGGVQLYP